ncbi:ShlB/FhaC/HecB family hemolysin secretion/activation protein [Suttonella indologenes]|uniref:Heme/hemopexin transporter protein huxB n=1 Tax=Suttonella indologenes TaxID=13276 RepID=A0A380N3X5_9GAMM|nr:ShlB/FhaC/HecB family hemolysin secretion/activation protein [Suttonella indologenes]SUO98621.1 Heme/hemopexin transporter protein huxB precursor [Suttonella indologenes]
MKSQTLTLLTFGILSANLAHATDAGTTLRHATQTTTPPPATITPLTLAEQGDISTDTTPISVRDVVLVGNTLLSTAQLEPELASVRGTTTTFGGLQTLAGKITDTYHKAGYPLATVIIPPQKIDGGVVQLQVLEGQIAGVSVENRSRLSDEVVQSYLSGMQSGQPLRQADSERALLLIKDLAGTDSVNYRLQGGNNGTDLAVDLGEAPLVTGFVQADNYGSKSTGEIRTRAGVNLNSPFGRGEKLSVQAMSSFKGVDYVNLSADMPVGADGLMFSGSLGHTRYDLGGAFKDLNATGTANTVDIGARYPLIRSNRNNLWLSASGEYRDLQDKIGSTNTVTDKSIKTLHLGANGYHQDDWLMGGYTQWRVDNTFGRLTIDSADARAIDSLSAKTEGAYYKIAANISRTQYFSPQFSAILSLNGQWANKNLDPAEQMSLGGNDAVAAYHSNDVSADIALQGGLELRYALTPYVSLSGFYDAGRAKLRAKPFVSGDNTVNLHGGGIGLYSQYKDFYLQGKIAWRASNRQFSNDRNPRAWLKVGYNF